MTQEHNLLIVEDDLSLGFLLMELLEEEGFQVKWCRDGASGLAQLKQGPFDLCLLDVMMPHIDGFGLARRIKKQFKHLPFLFLTARTLREDKLRAYAIGAEDYITKPFDEEELLCKIKVVLRRLPQVPSECMPTQFEIGDFKFDYTRHELSFKGQVRRITEKENEVLRLLCLHENKVLKREEAVEQIYGKYDYFLGRSFDVFISKLRKILKEDPRISIDNVFKVGFILNTPR